ncbi:hypothetical protein MP228_006967 [Amoeboaphelidium protococcarum]|nr:hypothetical protein MP228_006967 [Amoeboaphelidium protococcarum]
MFNIRRLSNMSELVTLNDPVRIFYSWFDTYKKGFPKESKYAYNAAQLATCGADMMPSVRTVLINWTKETEDHGLVLTTFSYYCSNKGKDINVNSNVALCFYWSDRQVRIQGTAQKCSDQVNDDYFYSRSVSSQINAHAKMQSLPLEDRLQFEDKVQSLEQKFAGGKVPRPEYWGGYDITATSFDFWEKAGRLDDRFQFTLTKNNEWCKQRLYP